MCPARAYANDTVCRVGRIPWRFWSMLTYASQLVGRRPILVIGGSGLEDYPLGPGEKVRALRDPYRVASVDGRPPPRRYVSLL